MEEPLPAAHALCRALGEAMSEGSLSAEPSSIELSADPSGSGGYRASGFGLTSTTVGDVTEIRIVVRRRRKFTDVPDAKAVNGCALEATLTGPSNRNNDASVTISHSGDTGVYSLYYRPTEEGPHSLRIYLKGEVAGAYTRPLFSST